MADDDKRAKGIAEILHMHPPTTTPHPPPARMHFLPPRSSKTHSESRSFSTSNGGGYKATIMKKKGRKSRSRFPQGLI